MSAVLPDVRENLLEVSHVEAPKGYGSEQAAWMDEMFLPDRTTSVRVLHVVKRCEDGNLPLIVEESYSSYYSAEEELPHGNWAACISCGSNCKPLVIAALACGLIPEAVNKIAVCSPQSPLESYRDFTEMGIPLMGDDMGVVPESGSREAWTVVSLYGLGYCRQTDSNSQVRLTSWPDGSAAFSDEVVASNIVASLYMTLGTLIGGQPLISPSSPLSPVRLDTLDELLSEISGNRLRVGNLLRTAVANNPASVEAQVFFPIQGCGPLSREAELLHLRALACLSRWMGLFRELHADGTQCFSECDDYSFPKMPFLPNPVLALAEMKNGFEEGIAKICLKTLAAVDMREEEPPVAEDNTGMAMLKLIKEILSYRDARQHHVSLSMFAKEGDDLRHIVINNDLNEPAKIPEDEPWFVITIPNPFPISHGSIASLASSVFDILPQRAILLIIGVKRGNEDAVEHISEWLTENRSRLEHVADFSGDYGIGIGEMSELFGVDGDYTGSVDVPHPLDARRLTGEQYKHLVHRHQIECLEMQLGQNSLSFPSPLTSESLASLSLGKTRSEWDGIIIRSNMPRNLITIMFAPEVFGYDKKTRLTSEWREAMTKEQFALTPVVDEFRCLGILWRQAYRDAGMKIREMWGENMSEDVLAVLVQNTGIESLLDAYYAGVPMSDILEGDA